MEHDSDVVVIGAGLAGLAAATTAARSGRRVVVLEARSEPGGRARTSEQQGYLFNEGGHALYLDGEAVPILRSFGVDPAGAPPPLAGIRGIRDDGRMGLLPDGPAALVRTDLVGLRGKLRLGKLLASLPKLDPAPYASTTLAEWYAEHVPDASVRRLLDAVVHTSTYANDADHVSAAAVILQVQRALGAGVRYLDGGWQVLVDGLRVAARDAGVELRTKVRVRCVRSTGDGPEVDLDGKVLAAPSVIIAAGGPGTLASLLDDRSAAATGWASQARPARVAALDVGLDEPWGDHPKVVLGLDDALYLSVHGDSATLAPEGATLVSTTRYLSPDAPVDGEGDRRQLERLLDCVRPGWRQAAAVVRPATALIASTDLPSAARGGLAGRPGPEVPDAPGVFVAGDWVGPVGMLVDAAMASAVAAGIAAADRSRRTLAA